MQEVSKSSKNQSLQKRNNKNQHGWLKIVTNDFYNLWKKKIINEEY